MAPRDIALFNNNATTTLASPITSGATVCSVVPGTGALFPNPSAGQYFIMTFVDQATRLISEIVHVTSIATDTMTIVRAQEGTTALSWSAGDIAAQVPTAGTLALFSQQPQSQAQATNYSVDTGTANSYVAAFSPAVNVRVTGLIMRVKASNANNGASTLDAGAGPISITNPDGSALGTGAIVANGIFEVIDPGSGAYQLTSSSQQAQSSAGAATTGDFKFRPTSETITGWVIANGLTIGNASSNAGQRANVDTANLFAWLWNNFSNTVIQVYTSAGSPTTRGANAAADFAANKQIQTYNKQGRGEIGADTMGGTVTNYLANVPVTRGNATTPGSVLGENLHTLITAELASHSHGISDSGHFHASNANSTTSSGTLTGGSGFSVGTVPLLGNATISTTTTGITVNSVGSSTAHNNVQFSDVMTYYIKL